MEEKRLNLRKTTEKDNSLVYDFINGLALYEKRPQDMTGSKGM